MKSNETTEGTPQDYWAFISYRHADNQNKEHDRAWATWLHQEIERYEIPAELIGTTNDRGDTIPERIYPVFRDEESLPSNADLGASITDALDRSKFLVVLCSPRAVQSQYVAQEIEHFKTTGKNDRILAVILAGEPGHPENECFPAPLRGIVTPDGKLMEPIAADLRLPNGSEGYTSAQTYKHKELSDKPKKQAARLTNDYEERLQLMKLKTIAGVLGVPLETLRNRDKAHQLTLAKKRQKILITVITAVSLLAVAAIIGGIFAWKNQKLAETQTSVAEKQTALAEAEQKKQKELLWQASEADCEAGINARDHGRRNEALAYFERGHRYEPENRRNARQALNLAFSISEPYRQTLVYPYDENTSIARISPDGTLIAVGNSDGSLRIFDLQGNELWFSSFEEAVVRLEFSPDGSKIAARSGENSLRLLDLEGITIWEVDLGDEISTFIFSPDNTHIAAASKDNTLRVFGSKGEELWRQTFHKTLSSLAYAPDGFQIIAGSFDSTARIFDSLSGEIQWGWAHPAEILSVKFSPDGKTIATVCRDGSVNIYSFDGEKLWSSEFEGIVMDTIFSPDSLSIATSVSDNSLHIFDAKGVELWKKDLGSKVASLSYSPDGDRLAVGTRDRYLRIFDNQGNLLWFEHFDSSPEMCAYSTCGSYLLIDSDEALRIFQHQSSEIWRADFDNEVSCLAYSPDGSHIAAGSHDSTLRVFDKQGTEIWTALFDNYVLALGYSPDGSGIAAGSWDKTLRFFSSEGTEIWRSTFDKQVTHLSFSPDNSLIAAASLDTSLRVFDLKGKEIWRQKHGNYISSISFSPSSSHLAIVSNDALHIFDIRGKEQWNKNNVSIMTFSPEGFALTSDSERQSLTLHAINGRQLWEKELPKRADSIAYSDDGSLIWILCDNNTTIQVFDSSGDEIWSLESKSEITNLAFSNYESMNAIARENGAVEILDNQGSELLRFDFDHGDEIRWLGFQKAIPAMAFSPDGQQIAAGSKDGTLRAFDLSLLKSINSDNSNLITSSLQALGSETFGSNGKRFLPTPNQVATAQAAVATAEKASTLGQHLQWSFTRPLDRTLSPTSHVLLRNYISDKLRRVRNRTAIKSAHSRAPWHPLAPISLARLKGDPESHKFLCELTLKRIEAADPALWGSEHLAKDAAFAALVMDSLASPSLARETAELSLSLDPDNELAQSILKSE